MAIIAVLHRLSYVLFVLLLVPWDPLCLQSRPYSARDNYEGISFPQETGIKNNVAIETFLQIPLHARLLFGFALVMLFLLCLTSVLSMQILTILITYELLNILGLLYKYHIDPSGFLWCRHGYNYSWPFSEPKTKNVLNATTDVMKKLWPLINMSTNKYRQHLPADPEIM